MDGARSTTGSRTMAASDDPAAATASSSAPTSSNGTHDTALRTLAGTPGESDDQSCQPK